MLGEPSSDFSVVSIDLLNAPADQTRGTGLQTIDNKLVVATDQLPVQSNVALDFTTDAGLQYQALLYELRDVATGETSHIVPNWFGVAIPGPLNSFDLSSDVYVVIYFHPTPQQGQPHYNDNDYYTKTGSPGFLDWKRLYAYVDRLGGQMAGAVAAGKPNNRVLIFPFLTFKPYTLPTREWFNIIHDILQDINTNYVNGICTHPKKVIVATFSDGAYYLTPFLNGLMGDPANDRVIEVWDFDSDIAIPYPQSVVDPHGKRLRAYWQKPVPNDTSTRTYIWLPRDPSWRNFPSPPPLEVPPLYATEVHHHIMDTMFLDATWNIENDNP